MLAQFKDAVSFSPQGEPVGNLSIGRGTVDGNPAFVAIVENRIASGAIGKAECDKLTSLFKVAAAQRAPVALFLDSAGARVTEGLPALGAFRRMFRAALVAADKGAPMAAVLGGNCYGGASMLACLCGARYFTANTRLAMSGPTILAAAAGASVLDESFRAIADVNIGVAARLQRDDTNRKFEGVVHFVMPAQIVTPREKHKLLGERIQRSASQKENLKRREFDLLYPNGYEIAEGAGVVRGTAKGDGDKGDEGEIAILGSLDKRLMTALRLNALAARVWRMVEHNPPKTLHFLIDCESHSAALEDEKVMLSQYLVDLACALTALSARGTRIETVVVGKLGGGIYVALAAASHEVNLIHGTEIQLLPGKAIAAVLGSEFGDTSTSRAAFDDYVQAGVADRELRIGFI